MSAKILGFDSELNMWTPENMQGLIILQTPKKLRDPEVLKKARGGRIVWMGEAEGLSTYE